MTRIHQWTKMWKKCELVIGPIPDTFENITISMTSNHHSTSLWQICELVIGSTPDSFKNITNSMTSIHQSTEMWQIWDLVIKPNPATLKISPIQWQLITGQFHVTNLRVGNLANSRHVQMFLSVNDKKSLVKFSARKLTINNGMVLKFGMIPVHEYLTIIFTGNCHWIKSVCKNITNLMSSNHHSTSMWQNWNLVIKPSPDTFKNIINYIISNHHSTSM